MKRIKCPECGFIYQVNEFAKHLVQCQEKGCGTVYNQADCIITPHEHMFIIAKLQPRRSRNVKKS